MTTFDRDLDKLNLELLVENYKLGIVAWMDEGCRLTVSYERR